MAQQKALLEKLKAQQKLLPQKREAKVEVPVYVPPASMVQVERKIEQETQFRSLLQILEKVDINNLGLPIVNDGYRQFKREFQPKIVEEEEEEEEEKEEEEEEEKWNKLSEVRKYRYVVEGIADRKGLPIDQRSFLLNTLVLLPVWLLKKFLGEYLKQNSSYKEFYPLWRQRVDVQQMFLEVGTQEEVEVDIISPTELRVSSLKEGLLQLAKAEAKSEEVDIELGDKYYDIIDKIIRKQHPNVSVVQERIEKYRKKLSEARINKKEDEVREYEKKLEVLRKNVAELLGKGESKEDLASLLSVFLSDKRKELHKNIAEPYIQLAEEMNIPSNVSETMIDLVNSISREEQKVYEKLPVKTKRELFSKDRKGLLEDASILGISNKYSDEGLRYNIAKKHVQVYVPSLNELKQKAEKLGIPTEGLNLGQIKLRINKYQLEHRPELLKKLVVDQELLFDELSTRKRVREAHKDWDKAQVEAEVERLRYDYQLVEPEKHVLVQKIHKLTGETLGKLYGLSKEDLNKLYTDVKYRLGLSAFEPEKERERIRLEWLGMSEVERKSQLERIRQVYPYVNDIQDIEAYVTVRLREAEDVEDELWIDKLVNMEEIEEANKDMTKEELEEKIEQERYKVKLHEQEVLIDKLHMITNEPIESLATLSVPQLRKRYLELEKGDEYWEEDVLEQRGDKSTVESSVSLKKCLLNTVSYSWVPGRVSGIWLSFGSVDKKSNALPYFFSDQQLEVPSSVKPSSWFRANSRYLALQCNRYAKLRRQTGRTLICYDENKHPLQFYVGYTVTGTEQGTLLTSGLYRGQTLIIQDEALFVAELQTRQAEYMSDIEKMEASLLRAVDNRTMEVAMRYLSRALRTVAPSIKDYGTVSEFNTPYIRLVVNTVAIKGETLNRELFTIIANITAYLQLEQAHAFKERVRHEYYLPEFLPSLSPVEKLPEVFENANVAEEDQAVFASFIQSLVSKLVRDMGYSSVQDVTKQRPKRELVGMEPGLQYKKGACVNGEDMTKIDKKKLVFYRDADTNKVYCLDIEKILERFQKGNYKNPHTNKEFSPEFLQMYIVTYMDKEKMETYSFPYFELLEQFKQRQFVNPETKVPFDKDFIEQVLAGPVNSKTKYSDIDNRLAWCQNPQDARFQPAGNIIYYKDPYDNQIYCFAITNLFNQFGQDDYVNARTGRLFSSNFVKRFNELYNVDLHKKGLLQNKFQERYGKEFIPHVTPPVKSDKKNIHKTDFLVPDLWKLVDTALSNLETGKAESLPEIKIEEEVLGKRSRPVQIEEEEPEIKKVKEECQCQNCTDACTIPNNVKTAWWDKTEKTFKIISFCGLDCLEDYQEWSKSKITA